MMDTVGNKEAQTEIAAIKVAAPNIALKIVDRAIQVHGGAGVTDDFPLAMAWAHLRTLRLADGPDEVHKRAIARRELRQVSRPATGGPVSTSTRPARQDRDRHRRLPGNRSGRRRRHWPPPAPTSCSPHASRTPPTRPPPRSSAAPSASPRMPSTKRKPAPASIWRSRSSAASTSWSTTPAPTRHSAR